MSCTTPTAVAARRSSVVQILWRSRFYRAAVVSLFLSGVGVSAANPQLTLFFVNDLGASLPVAGLYYLTNLAAPFVGLLIGRASDRRPDRLTLFRVGALTGAVGWGAMAVATHIWMPFVLSVLALSVAGAASAQVFAAARDELNRSPTGADNRVVSTIRMAFTLGWIVGPVLGSWCGAVFGLRVLLAGSALLWVAQLIPFIGVRAPRFVAPPVSGPEREQRAVGDPATPARVPARERSTEELRTTGGQRPARGGTMLSLFVFTGLCVIAISGDTIKFAYLPIYMEHQLHLPAGVRGLVISIQPFVELLLMPLFGFWADRVGPMRLLIVAVGFGIAANLCYALSGGVLGLLLAQTLMAALWAAIAGLGINVAQRLHPSGVGVASTVFLSAIPAAAAVGGVVGSVGVSLLGIPGVFYLPAVLCAVSVVGLFLTQPRREPARRASRA